MRRIFAYYVDSFRDLPRDVWILCTVLLVNRAGAMVLPFFTLYLTSTRDWTESQAGQALALYGLGALFGAYAGGHLTDRLGQRATQIFSLVSSGVGFALLATLQSPWSIRLCILVIGLVSEVLRPANMAAIADAAPPQLTARAMALARLAINVGMGIGPVVGGFLARVGYGWLFLFDALSCWAAACVVLLAVAPAAPRGAGTDTKESTEGASPWRDGPYLAFIGVNFIVAVCFFQLLATLPLYLQRDYQLTEDRIGLLLGLNPLLIVLFEMVLIRAVETSRRLPLIGLGSLLICIGLGMMPLGNSMGLAILTVVIWTVGEMFAFPLFSEVAATRGPRGRSGAYLGAYHMAFAAAIIVGPLLGTWIYETWGADMLWFGIAAVGPVILAICLILSRHMEPKAPVQ